MSNRPRIVMTANDMGRLERLLDALSANAFPGKKALEEELERAEVVEASAIPADVVTMNSTVRFKMLPNGETFEMTLTYPQDADGSGKTISVLAPVGSALLGLTQGDEIQWPAPGGGNLQVRIEAVVYQPERDGPQTQQD